MHLIRAKTHSDARGSVVSCAYELRPQQKPGCPHVLKEKQGEFPTSRWRMDDFAFLKPLLAPFVLSNERISNIYI